MLDCIRNGGTCNMDLKRFLFEYSISIKSLSEKLGCSRAYLSCIANGNIRGGARLLKDLEELTFGKVKPEDTLKLYEMKHAKKEPRSKVRQYPGTYPVSISPELTDDCSNPKDDCTDEAPIIT